MKLFELLAYHGTGKSIKAALKPPIFVTTDKEGAQWYASDRDDKDGQGIIMTGELSVRKTLDIRGKAGLKRLYAMIKSAGIEFTTEPYFDCDEIAKHSHYDGTNPHDIVYVPQFVDAVKKAGYDSIHTDDELESTSIDTYVIWDPKLFKIQKTEKGEAF